MRRDRDLAVEAIDRLMMHRDANGHMSSAGNFRPSGPFAAS
jgi:hypothetical protein